MTLILNRLRDGRSASPKELAEYVASRAGILDDRMGTVSLRTIQRDIRTIGELLQIDIECNSSRESFGIWNNPSDPVEEIVLKYDALDGAFVKTLPLHSSQEILSDTSDGISQVKAADNEQKLLIQSPRISGSARLFAQQSSLRA